MICCSRVQRTRTERRQAHPGPRVQLDFMDLHLPRMVLMITATADQDLQEEVMIDQAPREEAMIDQALREEILIDQAHQEVVLTDQAHQEVVMTNSTRDLEAPEVQEEILEMEPSSLLHIKMMV